MILETERLILRPFCTEDAADLYGYLHAPSVHCFYDMRIDTLKDAEKEAAERGKDPDLYLAIVLKENGKVIGEIFAHPEEGYPEGEPSDTYSPCWMLGEKYRGKGFMYEAADAYLDYLFNVRNARRIYIYTEDYNTACQHLSGKLGLRKEGLFKAFISFIRDDNGDPIYENTYQYAILKDEWNARAREAVQKADGGVSLTPLEPDDREQFILDNQYAFKYGAMEEFGFRDDHTDADGEIISRKTIEDCIDGGVAYRIRENGRTVGGLVLKINCETRRNELELLFVTPSEHSRGIGQKAWQEVERLYPETEVWETCTPYFEKRNLHFYINKCGFHAVEFCCAANPDPNQPPEDSGEGPDEMFMFEKVMKH